MLKLRIVIDLEIQGKRLLIEKNVEGRGIIYLPEGFKLSGSAIATQPLMTLSNKLCTSRLLPADELDKQWR